MEITDRKDREGRPVYSLSRDEVENGITISGLTINSPRYWELRHQRDDWPRSSPWALALAAESIPSGGSVCIAGCGQGMEAALLLDMRPDISHIFAFDSSPTAIKKAKMNIDDKKVVFDTLDIFKLKVRIFENTFDYAISIQNLEHWKPGKPHARAIENLLWSVKPSGKMFITGVGSNWDLFNVNVTPLTLEDGSVIQAPNDLHYVNWTEQSMYDLIINRGAKSVKFFGRRGKNRVIAEAEK